MTENCFVNILFLVPTDWSDGICVEIRKREDYILGYLNSVSESLIQCWLR